MSSLYETHSDSIHPGDLLQWSSRSVVGWLIRKFSKSEVNHSGAAMLFTEYMGKERRRFTLEALEHGFVLNLLSRRLELHSGKCYWHRLKVEYACFRVPIGCELLNFCGLPYDYSSLFRQVFGHVSWNARKLFCSESVYIACRNAGLPIPEDWNKKAPQPGDMLKLGFWEAEGVRIK